jgi:hypothetical protein
MQFPQVNKLSISGMMKLPFQKRIEREMFAY